MIDRLHRLGAVGPNVVGKISSIGLRGETAINIVLMILILNTGNYSVSIVTEPQEFDLEQPSATDRDVAESPRKRRFANPSVQSAKLHRKIWRWHFFAGIFAAPVLLVAAITGCLYAFRAEVEPIVYRERLVVTPAPTAATYDQQLVAATGVVEPGMELQFASIPSIEASLLSPDAQISLDPVTHNPGTRRATAFWFRDPVSERQQIVNTNPYTGQVTGTYFRDREFFSVVLKIHRTLFAGTLGRFLMELATCWGIVLIVTGVYLWWPKRVSKVRGVLVPRLRGKAYAVLRDLHVVPAVYLCGFLCLIMATGLFFTNIWGQGFRAATFATGGFPDSFVSPPKSQLPRDTSVQPLSLHQAINKVRSNGFAMDELSVSMPHEPHEPITISARAATGPSLTGMMWLDQYSGEILDYSHHANVPNMTKAMLYALPIHQGSIFGLPTKILAFVCAIMLVFSTISGVWMWWQRRPKGRLGTPRRYQDVRLPKGIIAMILLLAALMPLVAATLVLALIADLIVVRIAKPRLS